jgi:hypothetical protein
MKIENLQSEKEGNRTRVSAQVKWEDCERPPQEIYLETVEEFSKDISCNPHAFLVGCLLPAMRHGEKRILLDAEICPELRYNLTIVMNWLRHWYYEPERDLVQIEAKIRSSPFNRPRKGRAACFFSGGIDSLGTVRYNRLNFPTQHPGSIDYGLLIYGQNIESDNRPETFEQAFNALSVVAEDARMRLIPVYTNLRDLDADHKFFKQFHGAILGAVSHAFANRLSLVYISASDCIHNLPLVNRDIFKPLGSHPLLDPYFGSADMRILHDGMTLSRLDKTRLVADWEVGLQNIKVCKPGWPGTNCGSCEKCVRTMLALLALGILNKTKAFPGDDVSAQIILEKVRFEKSSKKGDYTFEDDYLELVPFLHKRGRNDLVRAIEDLVKQSHRSNYGLVEKIKTSSKKLLAYIR